LALHGHITIGTFLAFATYLGQLVSPVRQVTALLSIGQQARAGVERVLEVIDSSPQVIDPAAPSELVGAAQAQLALYLKASPADLTLQSANAQQWPDGALGCPQDGQAYPQVVTPGFLLIFTDAAQSVQHAVHTGRSATQMLLCARGRPINLSVQPAAAPAGPGVRMGELARAALAQELAVAEADIAIVTVEENEWRDSSLGCPKPGMNYLQVITPGYKIILEAQGKRYEFHSDTNRRVVRCDKP